MDELFKKMQKLIADKLEVDESKITLDATRIRTPLRSSSGT